MLVSNAKNCEHLEKAVLAGTCRFSFQIKNIEKSSLS